MIPLYTHTKRKAGMVDADVARRMVDSAVEADAEGDADEGVVTDRHDVNIPPLFQLPAPAVGVGENYSLAGVVIKDPLNTMLKPELETLIEKLGDGSAVWQNILAKGIRLWQFTTALGEHSQYTCSD